MISPIYVFSHLRLITGSICSFFFYQICSRSKVAILASGVWIWLTELCCWKMLLYHNGLYIHCLQSSIIPFWLKCCLCDAFRFSLFWQRHGRPEAMQLSTFVVASSLMTGRCVGVFKPTRAQKKQKTKNTRSCVDFSVLLRYKPKGPVHQMTGHLAAVHTHLRSDVNPTFASKGFVISVHCCN